MGGNVSKDSLYSEEAPRTFTDLRKNADVGTSDMEAAVIMRTTKQMTYEFKNKIKVGFASIILGTLSPDGGDSFTTFDRSLCNAETSSCPPDPVSPPPSRCGRRTRSGGSWGTL